MTDTETLLELLRNEYSVTNQQFTHILALRVWGDSDVAERIVEVDNIDFANGMAVVDHLVKTGTPIVLKPDTFAPGAERAGVLRAERETEGRFRAFLESATGSDKTTQSLLEAARAPRTAYADWLETRLASETGVLAPAPSVYPETLSLVAHLLTLMEQASIHAYVHRHHGTEADADAAWMTSGKAMMHLTAIVHHFAAQGALPRPGICPDPIIGNDPDAANAADVQMAARCAREAEKAAATCSHEKLAKLCGKIAIYCEALAQWKPGQDHPATGNVPSVFTSFEGTLSRM